MEIILMVFFGCLKDSINFFLNFGIFKQNVNEVNTLCRLEVPHTPLFLSVTIRVSLP